MLCPFLKLGCLSSWSGAVWALYIFWKSNPCWGNICKYISPYSWFPFHFTEVFFSFAELFILMKSHLFILSFMTLALGNIMVKILLHGISEIFLSIFFSRTFMVLRLIFKFFIHLEMFLCMVSWWLSFTVLHVAIQVSQQHLLKSGVGRLVFTQFFASALLVEY